MSETNALDVANAYRDARLARQSATVSMFVAVFAVAIALTAATMALVFRIERNQLRERLELRERMGQAR